MLRSLRILAPLALVLSSALPARGAPTSRAACFSAYERVQVGMRRGHLLDARAAASECLSDACPGALRSDCGQWLREVEARLPSVVVEVRGGDGKPVEGARLFLDGAPWNDHAEGRATEVDPGDHVVRADLGAASAETRVVVTEGRKAQRVVVELPGPPAPPPATATPPPARPADVPRPPPERASVPTAAIVLGGAGVLALGGFTFFAITGKNAEHGLQSCSPRCSDDAVAPVRQRYLAADVFLGVSVVALGVAAYLLLSRGYEPAPTASAAR